MVWADSFHRLVDLTIGQDATLQRAAVQHPDLAASPVVLPMPRLLSFMEAGGRPIATLRGPFVINYINYYMLFPEYLGSLDPLFAQWRHNGILRAVDHGALSLAHATVDIVRMVERDRPHRRCWDPSIRALLDGQAGLPPLRR